jgi:ferric-dicitrate binding protein FerR (iron transport regulator)
VASGHPQPLPRVAADWVSPTRGGIISQRPETLDRVSQFDHEPDPDFHLRDEAAEELKRLAKHPVEEAARLERKAKEGRTGGTLGIVLFGVGLGVAVIAAVLLALIALAVWLAVR